MIAKVFWIFGAGLSVLALLLMAAGASGIGGVIDYRAWLLLAFGILAVTIGNFSQTSGRGSGGG